MGLFKPKQLGKKVTCMRCGNAACIDGNCYNRDCTCGNIRFDQEIVFYK